MLQPTKLSTGNRYFWHVWVNTLHIGCKDVSKDKLVALGNVLKEIHQAKLQWQFPERPCVVEFYVPDDAEKLAEYQLSFWQKCHEPTEG